MAYYQYPYGGSQEHSEDVPPGPGASEEHLGAGSDGGQEPEDGAALGVENDAEAQAPGESEPATPPGVGSKTCPLCNFTINPGSRVKAHPQGMAHYLCPRVEVGGGGGN